MDDFPWPDGGHSLADFFSDRLVMSNAVPANVYDHDHDSKSERCQVVLMFKPLVDCQEHFATSAQTLHQDGVRKSSPSQLQNGADNVIGF